MCSIVDLFWLCKTDGCLRSEVLVFLSLKKVDIPRGARCARAHVPQSGTAPEERGKPENERGMC